MIASLNIWSSSHFNRNIWEEITPAQKYFFSPDSLAGLSMSTVSKTFEYILAVSCHPSCGQSLRNSISRYLVNFYMPVFYERFGFWDNFRHRMLFHAEWGLVSKPFAPFIVLNNWLVLRFLIRWFHFIVQMHAENQLKFYTYKIFAQTFPSEIANPSPPQSPNRIP